MSATAVRTARAAVFTALCVLLSTGAHVLLTGTPVPAGTLALVGALVFGVAYAFAVRERNFLRIAALLIPLELAADTVFTTGQHACYGPGGGPVTGSLRAMGIEVLCSGGEFGTPLARMAHGDAAVDAARSGSPWLLLAAHLAVGLAAAAWLRRGEAATARLLRAAAATAFRPLMLAVRARPKHLEAPPTARRRVAVHPPLRAPLLAHSVLRRGPPALIARPA